MEIKKFIINKKQKQKIDKIIYFCAINSELHKKSYVYGKKKSLISFVFFIICTFITGIVELVNYKERLNDNNVFLIVGLIQIFLSMLLTVYKNSKIEFSIQHHYDFYKQFSLILNKFNLELENYDTKMFLYKDICSFVNHYFDTINEMFLIMPTYPINILEKQQANNNYFYKINNEYKFDINKFFNTSEEKSNNILQSNFSDIYNKTKSRKNLLNCDEFVTKYSRNEEVLENFFHNNASPSSKRYSINDKENIEVFLINNKINVNRKKSTINI